MACDFADLVQNGFCTRPVAPLQGSLGPRSCTSAAVSRLNIHPPNNFLQYNEIDPRGCQGPSVTEENPPAEI